MKNSENPREEDSQYEENRFSGKIEIPDNESFAYFLSQVSQNLRGEMPIGALTSENEAKEAYLDSGYVKKYLK